MTSSIANSHANSSTLLQLLKDSYCFLFHGHCIFSVYSNCRVKRNLNSSSSLLQGPVTHSRAHHFFQLLVDALVSTCGSLYSLT